MRYFGTIPAAVLVVSISLLPTFYPLPKTFAQTNESIELLITDAIEDLQNGDTDAALTHSNLASQQLSSSANASLSGESTRLLLEDAIQDLQNGDTNAAQTHLNLVSQQLGIFGNDTSSNQLDITKRSNNFTKNISGTSNATGGPVFNFLTFEEPALGVKIQYPSVIGYSGKANYGDATGLVFSNGLMDFTIYIEDVSGKDTTLSGLLQEAMDLQKELNGIYFKVIESDTEANLLGHPAYRFVFTYAWTSTDAGGNVVKGEDSKTMEIGTVIDNRLYRLEYGSDLQYYDYYLPAVQRMIDSIEITGKPSTEASTFSSGANLTGSSTTNMTSQQPFQTQPQQNRINWGEICMSPLVDYVITEPCTTLTSPDGYTLTAEGERVLRCLAGGALVGLVAPELLTQIRQLGPAVNCGG